MDVFFAVIKILAGCGAFLLGFKLLSDNMEKSPETVSKRFSIRHRKRSW